MVTEYSKDRIEVVWSAESADTWWVYAACRMRSDDVRRFTHGSGSLSAEA